MTIATESTRTSEPFIGSGTTGPFTVSFKFLSVDEVTVRRYDSDNNETVLDGSSDYDATLINAGINGISITLTTALAVGEKLIIEGNTAATQPTQYANLGRFDPVKHENSYDRLTMIIQESKADTDRAIKLNPLDDLTSISTVLPPFSASKALVVNSAGTGFEFAEFISILSTIDSTISGLANNDFLVYKTSSSTFENITAAEASSLITGAFEGLAKEGTSIASAGTTDIGAADSSYVEITGTNTITSFGSTTDRNHVWLRFAGSLTLTHSGTALILPGAANITTQAGDTCEAIRLASGNGNWAVVNYQRASGQAITGLDITDYSAETITTSDLLLFGDATDSNNLKRTTAQGLIDITIAQSAIITGKTTATITSSDTILFSDADDSGNLKKSTVAGILNLVPELDINAKTDEAIAAGDEIIFGDVSDSNNLKKDTVQGILDLTTVPSTYGAVSTYVLAAAIGGGSIASGGTIAGSNLRPAAFGDGTAGDNTSADIHFGGSALSGTWRNMGDTIQSANASAGKATLWVRIS